MNASLCNWTDFQSKIMAGGSQNPKTPKPQNPKDEKYMKCSYVEAVQKCKKIT